jgi:hypothetical protein
VVRDAGKGTEGDASLYRLFAPHSLGPVLLQIWRFLESSMRTRHDSGVILRSRRSRPAV